MYTTKDQIKEFLKLNEMPSAERVGSSFVTHRHLAVVIAGPLIQLAKSLAADPGIRCLALTRNSDDPVAQLVRLFGETPEVE
jgi:hypothetical protein